MRKQSKIIVISFCFLLLVPVFSQANIYRYVDKYGHVVLTDRPVNSSYKRLVKTWKGWEEASTLSKKFDWIKNQKKFDPTIRNISSMYQLPHTLLHAVITAESSYNPNAVSRAGAVGLMQLMPETARRYGVSNRRDPRSNIFGGTRYLKDLLEMFNDDITLALAAYNAGENTVKKYNNQVPPYRETRNYINKVMQYYKKYRNGMDRSF